MPTFEISLWKPQGNSLDTPAKVRRQTSHREYRNFGQLTIEYGTMAEIWVSPRDSQIREINFDRSLEIGEIKLGNAAQRARETVASPNKARKSIKHALWARYPAYLTLYLYAHSHRQTRSRRCSPKGLPG
ncbi:hypothetical protein B0H13DRAFT_1874379 [Mycena leptocephala]|nr:hypothetical protein B0H13DRAFT_1874379 [Mycena leptocephala]